jgi:GTPase
VFENEEGQIIFVDTPGIYGKTADVLAKHLNKQASEALNLKLDVVLYIVDHTRDRDFEENKTLGIVRKTQAKKILVINKIDITSPTHMVQYEFMKDEFDAVVEVSALTRKNIGNLISTIFDFLPEGESFIETKDMPHPTLNMDSKLFVAELIREKAFLFLRREVPYTLTVVVDAIEERPNGSLYVQARILTADDRYKTMIIGKEGKMIKEIGMAARKEMETASTKKVYVDLTVETDEHWKEYLS